MGEIKETELLYQKEYTTLNNKKALYALVCESLKYYEVLSELLEKTFLLKLEKSLRNNTELGIVLLYEHLLGRGVTGKFQNVLKGHKSAIHSQCELMKVKAGVTSFKQLITGNLETLAVNLPKYVRVNTVKTDTKSVVKKFKSEGWSYTECTKHSFQEVVTGLDTNTFTTDPHIPDLLVFPASTDFHRKKLYLSGEIILQDKASCFPAHILSPAPGSHVIDCCAAPGNKTTHLACLMGNKGKLFAFDKDHKRLSTLQNMVQKVGATCVEAKCQDFLSVDPNDDKYRKVEYILVDPSCSGTGMFNRLTQHTNEECVSDKRLEQLSKFQITILKHALKFPSVKRIVYSTCSIQEQENEHVVEEVLSSVKDTFKMRLLMPDWPERGVKDYEHAQCCLRMSHDSALTNGFFVACFERKTDSVFLSKQATKNPLINGSSLVCPLRKKKKNVREKVEREINGAILDGIVENTMHENINMENSLYKNRNVEYGTHDDKNTHCKKRKKTKHRDVDGGEYNLISEVEMQLSASHSCKKKRKKCKHRDNEETEREVEQTEKIFNKKRKKLKQKIDQKSENIFVPGTKFNDTDNECHKKKRKNSGHCHEEGGDTNLLPEKVIQQTSHNFRKKKRKRSKLSDNQKQENKDENTERDIKETNDHILKKKRKESKLWGDKQCENLVKAKRAVDHNDIQNAKLKQCDRMEAKLEMKESDNEWKHSRACRKKKRNQNIEIWNKVYGYTSVFDCHF